MEDMMPELHVEITATGNCGHVLGTWTDAIAEKYPFYCEECGVTPTGKYPWTLATRITGAAPAEPVEAEAHRAIEREEVWAQLADLGDRLDVVEKYERGERALAILVVELLAGQDDDLGRRLRARGIAGLPPAPVAG